MALDIDKIIQHNLPDNQYFKEKFEKNQVVLHHTAGRSNGLRTVDHWAVSDIQVATAFVVCGPWYKNSQNYQWEDGSIVQAHWSGYWGYHTGPSNSDFQKFNLPWKRLDKYNIGIEVCNWGWLKEVDGKLYPWAAFDKQGNLSSDASAYEISKDKAVYYKDKWKGYHWYEKYTDAQIANLKDLVIYLCDKHSIPKTYNERLMWEQNEKALGGEKGIFTHNSFVSWKSDLHPQPEMVEMLKSLAGETSTTTTTEPVPEIKTCPTCGQTIK